MAFFTSCKNSPISRVREIFRTNPLQSIVYFFILSRQIRPLNTSFSSVLGFSMIREISLVFFDIWF